jgi:PAS domain S-box-containing protein
MNPVLPQTDPPGTMRQSGDNSDNSLLKSRNQFARLLLDRISTGVLLLSPEGDVLECNRAAASLLGSSVAALAGQPLAASNPYLEPQLQKNLSTAITRAAAGESTHYDIEFKAPEASDPTVLDFRFHPLTVQSGSSSPILVEIKDVAADTASCRTDEARYAHAAIVESSEDAIIGSDLDGIIRSWNPAAASLFGYSSEEIIGQPITRLMPEELHSEESQIMSKVRAGERMDHFETTRLTKNGKSLSVSVSVSPVLDEAGNIIGSSRIARDTSERRRADDARFRLAAIVESSDDAIASKDLKGIVTSWNSGAQRLFGFSAEEMIGQPITKIIPPELLPDEDRIISTVARGERIDHFETVRLRKDGETVDVSLTVSPVRDETGKIIGAAKIARDITQQKRAERALRTSERLASVGRLAATVAHEINNPLEAVTNLIFLARHSRSEEEVQKFLSMVEEELERISHLTRQTLGFYRETKGVARVHFSEIVESLLSVFAPRMRNKGIKISSEIDGTIEIVAVPGEIRQVVANLLSNSIDALDAGGEICLRVSPSAQWDGVRTPGARLTISDTGPGIPAEIRPRLFEPFFTTKKDVGTGLGLWVCKSIVENHAGSIQVHSSTTPGKSGTTFSVFLPTPALDAARDLTESAGTDEIAGAASTTNLKKFGQIKFGQI